MTISPSDFFLALAQMCKGGNVVLVEANASEKVKTYSLAFECLRKAGIMANQAGSGSTNIAVTKEGEGITATMRVLEYQDGWAEDIQYMKVHFIAFSASIDMEFEDL